MKTAAQKWSTRGVEHRLLFLVPVISCCFWESPPNTNKNARDKCSITPGCWKVVLRLKRQVTKNKTAPRALWSKTKRKRFNGSENRGPLVIKTIIGCLNKELWYTFPPCSAEECPNNIFFSATCFKWFKSSQSQVPRLVQEPDPCSFVPSLGFSFCSSGFLKIKPDTPNALFCLTVFPKPQYIQLTTTGD